MIKPNRNLIRATFTLTLATFFAASALFLNSPSASMQAGANTIVFDRVDPDSGYTKIFTMNADGQNVTDLGRGFGPSWSSDGTRIAYAYGEGSESSEIWTMDADGSNKQQLTSNWQSYAPAWSPAGGKIAFSSAHDGNHIYLINIDGSNQQQLIHTAEGVIREYAPSWSHDGTKVIFLGEKIVNGSTKSDYYSADASTGATERLTFFNSPALEHAPAAASPDGTNMVIEYQHDLQAYRLDGSGTMLNLTDGLTGSIEYADYAPSGTRIIFTHGTILHVMKADGTERVSLDVVGRNADWNPTAIIVEPTPVPTATPTPQIQADIRVNASSSASNVVAGDEVIYTIQVENLGGENATGVALVSPFPSTLTLVDAQSSQGSCSVAGGQLNCQLGAIAAGGQANITLRANASAIGFISMLFTGSAIETDPDMTNNSASVGVSVSGPCAQPVTTTIEITRSQWRRNDRDGQDELILTIRNRSGSSQDPRLIFVFDNLPQGVTIDPSVVSGYTQCSTPQGSPYLVAHAPNGREWKDMQTVSVRVLFNNPSRAGIPYDWRLYSGEVNP